MFDKTIDGMFDGSDWLYRDMRFLMGTHRCSSCVTSLQGCFVLLVAQLKAWTGMVWPDGEPRDGEWTNMRDPDVDMCTHV